MSQRRADYVSVTDLISCPVIRALENRDLNDAIDLLRDIAPSIVAGRAALKIGEREMAFGNSSDAISHLSAAVDLLSKISDDDAKVEAYIRIDEARAQLSLGKLRQDAALLKAASATAAAAALRAPEGPQKALALTFIGDAETALGSHGSAAKAYARAWALGFDAPWIKINWTVSATAAVDESLISRSVLDRGISKAPRTTDEAIRKLAEPVSREH